MKPLDPAPDVIVLGAGLVGLCTALAASTRGLITTLVSTSQPGEASGAAAGMLAPALEHAGDGPNPPASNFALAARDRYPDFLAWVTERTGQRIALDRNGILHAAFDDPTLEAFARDAADGAEILDAPSLVAIEPALGHCAGAVLHPADGAVDNVHLMQALADAVARSNIRIIQGRAHAFAPSRDGGSVELEDGSQLFAAHVVLASGAWAATLRGLPRALPVRPVRGQMIAYDARPVRRVVYGPDGYIVPRANGRTLVGATMEEAGFDPATTPEAREGLSAMAGRLCPALASASPPTQWSGLRPLTPDLLPILGPDPDHPSLLYACGHSRNGVLLAPLTGDCIASVLAGDESPCDLSPFAITRFESNNRH